jgi:hypothetical protein
MKRIVLQAVKITALACIGNRAIRPELLVRTHKEGVACGSVSGPPNLKSVASIHREVPTIPLDPPGNGPDVTQIKKIRQHKSKNFYNRDFAPHRRNGKKCARASKRLSSLKRKICKNPLALAKTCGRLAPFLGFGIQIPKVGGQIICCGGFFNRGGQGTWALFFSSSFG